jgi:L-ascorbate metabolism protein UlaG (beta-lactamase superfamily)
MVDGAVQAPGAGASGDRIVFVGHATVLIELDGVRLLTDPLLRDRVAHLRRRAHSAEVMAAPIDTALISHLHRDHLDLPSLRMLGRETPLLVPAGAGEWLRRRRFTNVTELHVGEVASAGTLSVSATRACHDDRRRPGGPRAQALGYLVRARRSVYFAGDTELFDGMSELGAGYGESGAQLDVALLPVAGWGPTLGPGHMDPLQAAQAAALLNPRVAIPIHWGTLLAIGSPARHRARLGDPPRQFAEHVDRLAPGTEVRIVAPGEETVL